MKLELPGFRTDNGLAMNRPLIGNDENLSSVGEKIALSIVEDDTA
jgi:hypothetical protein